MPHLSDSALATCQLAAQRLSYCTALKDASYCTALKDARRSCKQYCQTCRGKVVIIGAGPAGSTAAILLSKRGSSVEVYETRPQPTRPYSPEAHLHHCPVRKRLESNESSWCSDFL